MTELLVGRQPIFNAKTEVVGYEILYRSPQYPYEANFPDGDIATGEVILNSFSEIGLDKLVGKNIAFFNLTENYILGKYPIPFPPQQVALEILETCTITNSLISSLKVFTKQGYSFVLDDVDRINDFEPLLDLVKIVKIDLTKVDKQHLPRMVDRLKQKKIIPLAEKVETIEEYSLCRQIGFDLFQGYYLCKPNVIRRRRIDSSRMVILSTLSEMQNPMVCFKVLEKFISQDITLSYKLLRLTNSIYISPVTTIKSIEQAISMIGINNLRGWLVLILMSSIQDKPHELTSIALVRGRFCELLAKAKGKQKTEEYFMVGFLSVMDALMDQPLDIIITQMKLSKEIVDALLYRTGTAGEILNLVIAYEHGDLERIMNLGLSASLILDMYIESLRWTTMLTDSL
jgi:c-di-GMP phosphodiesterase